MLSRSYEQGRTACEGLLKIVGIENWLEERREVADVLRVPSVACGIAVCRPQGPSRADADSIWLRLGQW